MRKAFKAKFSIYFAADKLDISRARQNICLHNFLVAAYGVYQITFRIGRF